MLLPLYDSNPRNRIPFQYVTVGIIAVCAIVYLWQASLDPQRAQEAVFALGTIPAVVFGERQLPPELLWVPAEATLLTSMFMHGGPMHLIGNMLYLWILGDNVEDAMGHLKFLIFYLLCGLAAVMAHMLIDTSSTVPLVGASGAISGVIGAYLLLHPKAYINVLIWIFVFVKIVPIPAWIALAFWIGLQVVNGAMDPGTGGGVAFWAHVGGAVAGMVLVPFFKHKDVPLFNGVGGRGQGAPHRPRPGHARQPGGRPAAPWGRKDDDDTNGGSDDTPTEGRRAPKIRLRRPGRGGVKRPWH
ncbi:MAG TPA: rhomboid family intramembrane serine protease [Rhodospirillaceae bacterium]|nr:rhomboid family intramembrane serine protease [Rhodospirillaceae bacterium]|tara:strand:+ start:302 stop:1201 length:900 start_codon:yes stop_codon:yes gene_type:complete